MCAVNLDNNYILKTILGFRAEGFQSARDVYWYDMFVVNTMSSARSWQNWQRTFVIIRFRTSNKDPDGILVLTTF